MIKCIEVQPGDVFGTRNPMLLGRAINGMQYFWSSDNNSVYSHSGIIESATGDTYEALWSIEEGHLDEYCSNRVIIARYTDLNEKAFKLAMKKLKKRHDDQCYPWWRIPLHIIPPLAKYISYKDKWVVCSELVAEYEYLLGLRHYQFVGTNPDKLADEWKRWKGWEIIGEGQLTCVNNYFYIDDKEV